MLKRSTKGLFPITALVLVVTRAAVSSPGSQTGIPDTPAGKRLQAAVQEINAGDIESLKAFIANSHTRGSIDFFGEDSLFDIYYGIFEAFHGLDFHHLREPSPTKVQAVFRCRLTGTGYLFGVTVQSEPPHKIRGMTILPLADTDDNAGSIKLSDEEIAKKLAFVLDRFEEAQVFSGVVLIAKNDRIVFHKSYGWASREPERPIKTDTKFNLASINKMFTAVAIAQLCEKGMLSYEDPIRKFLDANWIPPGIGNEVKIKHLLSHTSGIGGDFNITYVQEAVKRGFKRIEDYKVFTSDTDLGFKPGEKHEYSNLGYHLLGAIIERASGEDYYTYMESHVFEPAGMTGAEFREIDTSLRGLAIGYEKIRKGESFVFKDNRKRIPLKGTPAGCGYATAEDLFQFARAMRRNTLVTAETRKILFTPKVQLNSPRYGFGFKVRDLGGRRTVFHTGGYIGINNSFSMGLDDGLTVIILSNIDILTGSVCEIIDIIIKELMDRRRE